MRVRTKEKRQEIVQVAARIFGDVGYHRASMSAISAELGGSKATLYGYFESKEQLFAAVLMDALDEYGSKVFSVFEDDERPLEDVLRSFGGGYIDFVTRPEVLGLQKSAMAGEFSDEVAAEIYKNGQVRGWGIVEAYMGRKMEAGAIKAPSAKIAGLHLKGLLECGVLEPTLYRYPPHLSVDMAIDVAVKVFLKAYAT